MLSKEQLNDIMKILDTKCKQHSPYEYGLPLWDENWCAAARELIREYLEKPIDKGH